MSSFRFGSGRVGTASPDPDLPDPEPTPFCTSPTVADEAMRDSIQEPFTEPTSTTAAWPVRGLTMKEYEERLAQLKKENFNLKLRIYFLEERMGQISGLKDKEEAVKKIVELQVENESMQKELSEKDDLLSQAGKAIDLLEEKNAKDCAAFQTKIQELEKELQENAAAAQLQLKFSSLAQSTDSQYSSTGFEVDQLTAQVQELEEQRKVDRAKICQLETELESSRHLSENISATLNSQKDFILTLEQMVGVKQSDLFNKIQKLLDCEKYVAELETQMKVQEESMLERESRHAKVKANAANLSAKLNTANLELQRLREEVKSLKKWKHDELKMKTNGCSKCSSNAAEYRIIHDKYAEKCKESEKKTQQLTEITRQLFINVSEKDEKIAELKNQLKKANLAEKEKAVEKTVSDDDAECRLQSIQASLQEKESQLVACEQRLEARDNRIQELELEVQSLRKEFLQLSERNQSPVTKLEPRDSICNDVGHGDILRQLSEKEKENENLKMELKKRNFNLQELVNKELWDKNKQIERLELRLTAQCAVSEQKELDLKDVKQKLAQSGVTDLSLPQNLLGDMTELQEQLKISLEEQKYLSREVDNLKERLRNTPERDAESMRLQRLLEDNKRLQQLEQHHRHWRKEASQALSVLRTRLEELAIFLDELLHQPALVVGLCADRQRVLRAAINGSLELSRTLANLSNESPQEDSYSHLNYTVGSGSLCIFGHDDNESSCQYIRPCEALNCEKKAIGLDDHKAIVTLRKDTVETDSKAIQTSNCSNMRPRRRSRSQPQGSRVKEPISNVVTGSQSDSEAWSEPDRSVSQARMGIHNESSRTVSSVASTVRRVSVGEFSYSSSCDSKVCQPKSNKNSFEESANCNGNKLAARTHCLEKLNQALEDQLQAGMPVPSTKTSASQIEDRENSASVVWSNANSGLSEKVINQEKQLNAKHSDLLDMKFALVEMHENADGKFSSSKLRVLEEKVQELSVQVLEVEVRREQAEQDALQALEQKEQLKKDLCDKLTTAEKEMELAKHEVGALQLSIKHLLNKKIDLEKEVTRWKGKAQELEQEVEKWKNVALKYEVETKEIHLQLSLKFKEKLLHLEKLKTAAEQRADDLASRFNEAELKFSEVERRGKEKVRLLEEQLKLKQAEIERRSEELQEKLKREAEIRASRKLEKIVEQRMAEYDAESRSAANKRLCEVESTLLSQINDLERRAVDSEKKFQEAEEKHRQAERELKEQLAEAQHRSEGCGVQYKLNEAAVAASQTQLENARLANENLKLEQQVRWLQGEALKDRKQIQDQLSLKIKSLTQANSELQKQVRELEQEIHSNQSVRRKGHHNSKTNGGGSSSSESKVLTEITNRNNCNTGITDYVSQNEDQVYPESSNRCWYSEEPQSPPAVVFAMEGNPLQMNGTRISSASPDLGIESDQGHFSSLEAFPLKKSITAPALNSAEELPAALKLGKKQQLDYKSLEQENLELKQHLQHTRQTLQQTYAQLAAANQRKRLVEKAICQQLHKTHHILRKARDNFETNPSSASPPSDSNH